MKDVLFIVLMVIALLASGCNEAQRPVWGKGELPAEHQFWFGTRNGSRLDFIQNQAIIELRDKTIKDMEVRIKALEKQAAINTERIDTISKLTFITHWDNDGKRVGGYDPNEVTK